MRGALLIGGDKNNAGQQVSEGIGDEVWIDGGGHNRAEWPKPRTEGVSRTRTFFCRGPGHGVGENVRDLGRHVRGHFGRLVQNDDHVTVDMTS